MFIVLYTRNISNAKTETNRQSKRKRRVPSHSLYFFSLRASNKKLFDSMQLFQVLAIMNDAMGHTALRSEVAYKISWKLH